MRSIKPGRGPSAMGAAGGVFMALFGIVWIGGAVRIGAPGFMVLFGVLFVLFAIFGAAYSVRNATATNRFSDYDLTGPGEEADPLNEVFGEGDGEYRITTAPESVEERLSELASLKEKGLVTEEEYQKQRARILEEI